jgi:hypothetical protein
MHSRRLLAATMVGLALFAAACSSGGSNTPITSAAPPTSPLPTSAPSTSDVACAQRQAVKEAFDALVDTDVVANGTNALKANFDAFTAALQSLKSSASSRLTAQLDAVQSAVDGLKKVVDDAGSAGAAATATQFAAGLVSLKTAVQSLMATLDQDCSG